MPVVDLARKFNITPACCQLCSSARRKNVKRTRFPTGNL